MKILALVTIKTDSKASHLYRYVHHDKFSGSGPGSREQVVWWTGNWWRGVHR